MRPMNLKLSPLLFAWLFACAALAPHALAPAAEREIMPATATDQMQPLVQSQSQPRLVPQIGRALDDDALDALRGGESSVDTQVHDDGEVNGNTAEGVTSGSNTIADGSFANVNGISTVIQNSGSNVLIQNGTAVNVQFVDPVP